MPIRVACVYIRAYGHTRTHDQYMCCVRTVYTCVYGYMRAHSVRVAHMCVRVHTCACGTCTHINISCCAHMCVCVRTPACLRVWIHARTYSVSVACMCVCTCIHACVCGYIRAHRLCVWRVCSSVTKIITEGSRNQENCQAF